MKIFAVLVWLSFTLCAIFALLQSACECSLASRPHPFWQTAETQSGPKTHKKRSNFTTISARNLRKTAKRPNSSPEEDLSATDEDIYLTIVKLAADKKSEALAGYLRTVKDPGLQRFIVNNIEPDCETCLDALVWALTNSPVPWDAMKRLQGKILLSVREKLFKSLLENENNLIERQGNAAVIISLLSEANDDREQEMMVALANSDLRTSLRATALRFIDPPFTREAKDILIAAVSSKEDFNTFGVIALEKIKESPFTEAVPVLTQVVISYPDEIVVATHFGDDGVTSETIYYIRDRKMCIIQTLGKAGTPEAKNALVEIATSKTDAGLRTTALCCLNSIDPNLAVSIAKAAFFSDDCPERRQFANALSSFMDVSEREDFFTSVALNDSNIERRAAAIELLARISPIDTVATALLQLACTDSDCYIRRTAVRALARNDSTQVQRALIELATSDPDSDVRGAAVNSLDLSFPETVPTLMQIASQSDCWCCYAAMSRLASTGTPQAAEFLLSVVQDEKKDYDNYRGAAAQYLQGMGGEYRVAAFREVLSGESFRAYDRRNWATWAAYYREPEIEAILRDTARNDPDKDVRDAAAQSLQQIYRNYEAELVRCGLANAPDTP
jgi:HEAT repeat protein